MQRHLARDGLPRVEGGSSCGVSGVVCLGTRVGEASHPGPATGPTRLDTSSSRSLSARLCEVRLHSPPSTHVDVAT